MEQSPRLGPVRTCVGCRSRVAKGDLVRVVDVDGTLTVDSHGRLPGRGAHVHPDTHCLEVAALRRAFARALRKPGVVDVGPVIEALVQQGRLIDPSHQAQTEAGREQ